MAETLVETIGLKKYFRTGKSGILETLLRQQPPEVKAVDDVNIKLQEGEVLALVGERVAERQPSVG